MYCCVLVPPVKGMDDGSRATNLLSASCLKVLYIVPYTKRWEPSSPKQAACEDGNLSLPDDKKGHFVCIITGNLHGIS